MHQKSEKYYVESVCTVRTFDLVSSLSFPAVEFCFLYPLPVGLEMGSSSLVAISRDNWTISRNRSLNTFIDIYLHCTLYMNAVTYGPFIITVMIVIDSLTAFYESPCFIFGPYRFPVVARWQSLFLKEEMRSRFFCSCYQKFRSSRSFVLY